MAPLAGKSVLVIGGSSGMGFAVAKAALAEGASVVIASSSATKLEAAASKLVSTTGHGDRLKWHILDLNDEESFKTLFDDIGKVDHLIHTAGGPSSELSTFPDIDLATDKLLFDVRFWGVVIAAKYAAKGFVTESFTCTSGTSAMRPAGGWSVVAGVTGSVISMARGLAIDLAPLRVNCIAPGFVDTEMWTDLPEEAHKGRVEAIASQLLVKHAGSPDEIADAYIFAMKCTYFTGQTLFVDGGSLLV